MAMIRPETEMKDSGIEYIGKIPKDWEVRKVGHLAAKITDYVASGSFATLAQNVQYLDEPDYARLIRTVDLSGSVNKQPVYVSKEAYEFLSNSNLFGGELILPNIGSVGCVYQYKKMYEHATLAPNSILLDMKENNRFYFYWFSNPIVGESLKMLGNSAVQVKFNKSQLRQYMVPKPPLSEQQAIADYLDETCSKIDEIIAEAKASIDEYEKLRQATIDENILGYDSVHIKLRQLGSLKNGLNFSHSDDVANIKFLGVGCFKDNMILSEVADFADEHINFEISEEYLLSNGDIVFVRSNGSKELVGRSIMVENIDYPVTFSGFCIRFRNMHTELVDNRFLLYYFRTTHFKQSLLKYSNDSTNINNLNQEMLNAIRINAPVIGEQKLLVKKLEEQVLMIDSLISEKESLINDLEAYKKSLIYEVVTGKRRVV